MNSLEAAKYIADQERNLISVFRWEHHIKEGFMFWAAHLILTDEEVYKFKPRVVWDGLRAVQKGHHILIHDKSRAELFEYSYITYTQSIDGIHVRPPIKPVRALNLLDMPRDWDLILSDYEAGYAVAASSRDDGRNDISIAIFA